MYEIIEGRTTFLFSDFSKTDSNIDCAFSFSKKKLINKSFLFGKDMNGSIFSFNSRIENVILECFE